MAKHKEQKLIENIMADTGISQNAVSKVVDALKGIDSDEVSALLGRKPEAKEESKPKTSTTKAKVFRTSGSEEVDGS
jgi:hypothetical protein